MISLKDLAFEEFSIIAVQVSLKHSLVYWQLTYLSPYRWKLNLSCEKMSSNLFLFTKFQVSYPLKEQLTLVTFFKLDDLMSISIPPTYTTLGENFPSFIPQPVLKLGFDGSKHFPHKSFVLLPFGTLSQSKHVELSPLHFPQASLPGENIKYENYTNCCLFIKAMTWEEEIILTCLHSQKSIQDAWIHVIFLYGCRNYVDYLVVILSIHIIFIKSVNINYHNGKNDANGNHV